MIEHHTDLLLLRDGRILAHNLTPTMAAVLRKLGIDTRPVRTHRRPRKKRIRACLKNRSSRRKEAQILGALSTLNSQLSTDQPEPPCVGCYR